MHKTIGCLTIAVLLAAPAVSQTTVPQRPFGTLREQATLQQEWLQERLESVLPALMREHGVDMWVLPMREYNEDPLFPALVAPATFAARRRTVYIFHDRGPEHGVDRIAIGGSSQGGAYEVLRATERAPNGRPREFWGPAQWQVVADAIKERDPRSIAVNVSHTYNFADGLTAGEWEQLAEALGPEMKARVRRAEKMALYYLAIRVPSMNPVYRDMQALVHEIIARSHHH
jgi:hypothetical protein